MQIIDLKTNFEETLWNDALQCIQAGNDSLKKNYENINFEEFLSFTCVVDEHQIIAFSGLQYDVTKWGTGIARCSSRMWVHPEHRITSLSKFTNGPKFLNSYYCVPLQLEIAKKHNLDVVFVSREHNPAAFNEYLELLYRNTQHKFAANNSRYWICGSVRDPSCLQYVGVCYLTPDGVNVWNKNMQPLAWSEIMSEGSDGVNRRILESIE